MNVGDKITGRDYYRSVSRPPAGSVVKVTARGNIRAGSGVLVIGCREYTLDPLIRSGGFSVTGVKNGPADLFDVTAHAQVVETGIIIPGSDNTVSPLTMNDYVSVVELVSLPPEPKVHLLPPGLYRCDTDGHHHDYILVNMNGKARWARYTNRPAPGSEAWIETTGAPGSSCTPRLAGSFHGIAALSNHKPVESPLTHDSLKLAWQRGERYSRVYPAQG
jgi:hypothetical protein